MMRNYIEALKEGKGYDYICNHGHELSKTELISIIKELDYAIYTHDRKDKSIYEFAAESLNEEEEYDN